MKTIIILSLVAVALAAPPSSQEPIQILSQESDINPDGSFKYTYETSNGISSSANGELRNIGAEEPALQIQGQFKYPSEDGQEISLTYIANENGYVPQGSILPTPHPIPADIQRALDYLATAPPQTGN
ncbi:larval cuticle protein LCP-17-like [Pararge aegeria]|uniref:Jg9529 protein n=1 Tax=Pararge aegeria aegeria TaxID=348720 RepID=A0A8S4RJS5_9NEOP|nr:larval cuticle protein LCP-17-like [Pararge aegeria]CAH2237037.1 jg9529 [Pararge aegeria aegeria]